MRHGAKAPPGTPNRSGGAPAIPSLSPNAALLQGNSTSFASPLDMVRGRPNNAMRLSFSFFISPSRIPAAVHTLPGTGRYHEHGRPPTGKDPTQAVRRAGIPRF